jgi:6-phosphogluconate dehydrogenase
MSNPTGDIALIGLAVMGQNLILNMNDHGFTVVAYNRTTSKVDEFLAGEAKGTNIQGAHSIPELVSKLKTPRRINSWCRTCLPGTLSSMVATRCMATRIDG